MVSRPNAKWEIYYSRRKKKNFIALAYEWLNKNHFIPMFMNELYKLVGRKKGMTILEPGCGSGLMSSYLAKDNKVTILDLSKNALHTAKDNFNKNGVKGKFILGDLRDMSFCDNSFDVVWNQGVLEHFKDPTSAMKEMIRVAKKGGHVVIVIPAFLSPLHFIYVFLNLFNLSKLWPFDEQEFFSVRTFKSFMEKAGYKNIKIKRLWLESIGFSQVGYCQKID